MANGNGGQVVRRRSAIEAFGCPFRYQRIYQDGVDDTGDEALRGRAFHLVGLVYVLMLVAAGERSDHEIAQKAFAEGMRQIDIPDHLRDDVRRLFVGWTERFELDTGAFLAAEELVSQGARQFQADLVYARPGELEIVDWKSYFKGLTDAQARKELQPKWYLVEAKRTWPGFARYRFTYDFVRLGFQVSIVFTADEVDALEPEVQSAIDQVERAEASGEFPALPGSHCGLCKLVCPVVDDALASGDTVAARVVDAAQARAVAGQILAMERRLKLLRKALGSYCSLEGPVVVGGQEFAHTAGLTVRYPAAPALAAIEDAGLSTARATLSKTGLGFGSKIPGKLWDALAAIATTSRRSSFRHRKTGEDTRGAQDLLQDDNDDDDDAER